MNLDDFTKYAKEQLDQHPTSLNEELLWNKVEDELYPKKDRAGIWIWLGGLGLIVGIILFTLYLSNENEPQAILSESNQSIESKNTNEKNKVLNTESKKISEKATYAIPVKETVDIIKSTKVKEQKISKEPSKTIIPIQKNITSFTPATIYQPEQITKQNIIRSSPISTPLDKIIEYKISQKLPIIKSWVAHQDATVILPYLHLNLTPESKNETDIEKQKSFHFGIGLSTALLNPTSSLSNKSAERIGLLDKRLLAERDLETISQGIDLYLSHKSGLNFSIGINYMRSARSVEFVTEIENFERLDGINRMEIDPITMDTILIEAMLSQRVLTKETVNTFNNVHTFNIPLNIGYTYRKERWSAGLEIGAFFNLSTKHEGFILDEAAHVYNLENDPYQWFRNRLNIRYMGSFQIGYHFKKGLHILAGPTYLGPVVLSEDTNPIDQIQQDLGAQIKLRYWLN